MRVTVLERTPVRLVVRVGPWRGWWHWTPRLLGWALALFALLLVVASLRWVSLTAVHCTRWAW